MNKLMLGAAAAAIGLLAPMSAHAMEEFNASPASDKATAYVSVSAGLATDTEFQGFGLSDGNTIGAAAGIDAGPVRFQAGANRLTADSFGANIHAQDWYVEALVDLPAGLYAGGGLDFVRAEVGIGPWETDVEDNGWHATVGMRQELMQDVDFFVEGRYIEAADAKSTPIVAGLSFAL